MDIIALLAGLIIGAVIAFFILKFKFERDRGVPKDQFDQLSAQLASVNSEKSKAEERSYMFDTMLKEANQSLSDERLKVVNLSASLAALQNELENANQKLQEQKNEMQALQSQFSAEFKNLANEILEEKSRKFTELNQENLSVILNPLQEKIRDFQSTINNTYDKDSKERTTLSEQIRNLTELNQQMTKDASNLTSALKGQSKTQGDWGELILEQILERSGLDKGLHYSVQKVMEGEDNKAQKPDVVVNLPEGKHLIIDSKVSLTAYTDYCKAEGDDLQRTLLKQHISSIKKHLKELSEKKYQNIYQLQSVDYVLMFIPIEPAFAVAVKEDINLYNEALERNIVIVTTSTLIATLRTTAHIWRQEKQSQNAIEIARKSGELYDKFVGFIGDFRLIGEKIDASKRAYGDAMKKLNEGRGNIIGRAEELKAMGAKASKTIPAQLVEQAAETEQIPSLEESNGK